MSYTKQDYQRAFEKFKANNPSVWPRYKTDASDELLLAYMVKQQQPASQVTCELSIKDLAQQGLLVRIDGGTLEKDTQAELRKIVDRLDAPELTRNEVEHFQSLHPRQLADLYWADGGSNAFRIRFDKAVREQPYGLIFSIPGRPASNNGVEPVALTAADYHAMPANRIIQRLKSEPGFKKAVDNLIKAGQI